ncbi:MAG: metal-dependent transcriptional regulator [Firmicutes bacterium]|nr:metal-dependent transcriptional regulator [Bacillota bacterium]
MTTNKTDKLQRSGEDYLEAIYTILQTDDHAHSVDIAKALGVTKPSAFVALQNLAEQGYISKQLYGAVVLTPKGVAYAQSVLQKHKAITKLFVDILGVDPKVAEQDACKVEHCLSEQTTQKLYEFLETKDKK